MPVLWPLSALWPWWLPDLSNISIDYLVRHQWSTHRQRLRFLSILKRKENVGSVKWRNKADKEITRLTRGRKCVICGTTHMTCGHHFIPRSRSSFLRHDIQNLFSLCPKHHMFSNDIAAHSTNALACHAFVEAIKAKFPERFDYLISNQHKIWKPDYKARYEELCKLR